MAWRWMFWEKTDKKNDLEKRLEPMSDIRAVVSQMGYVVVKYHDSEKNKTFPKGNVNEIIGTIMKKTGNGFLKVVSVQTGTTVWIKTRSRIK